MKKVKSIVIILLVCIISFSCKKKKDEPPHVNVVPASTMPYSILQTAYRYANNNNVISLDSTALAIFSDAPLNSSLNYVDAGDVSLNDSGFYYFSGVYSNSTAINISANLKWTVAGSATISPFSYTYSASYPKYTGGNLLPDTCYKSSGITITISGVSNTTNGVSVFINQSSATSITKYLPTPNGVINISAAELSSYSVNAAIYIELMFSNTHQQTFGGKAHQFNNDVSYNKISYLK